VAGKVLSWDDVLHDGPVPGGISTDALREVRASFLAEMAPVEHGGGSEGNRVEALDRLTKRDGIVDAWQAPILLWFEHDLYDQLQLIQILDRLGPRQDVHLLQMGDFVTSHNARDLRAAEEAAVLVTSHHYMEAAEAWEAFTAADPKGVAELVRESSSRLPFLAPALTRWLEMFPGDRGLSLTEGWVLDILSEGPQRGATLFRACQARDTSAFRGDWSFWRLLVGLQPLLSSTAKSDPAGSFWSLTDLGVAVGNGELDRVDAVGIDRWLGGTHLTAGSDWRSIDGALIRRK
jgi:hypothetical protein